MGLVVLLLIYLRFCYFRLLASIFYIFVRRILHQDSCSRISKLQLHLVTKHFYLVTVHVHSVTVHQNILQHFFLYIYDFFLLSCFLFLFISFNTGYIHWLEILQNSKLICHKINSWSIDSYTQSLLK